ncbi:MAG TPA: sulfur carrier protein ThiS [Acidimicrobiales bacterium]|jgi:sulfur carrier protein
MSDLALTVNGDELAVPPGTTIAGIVALILGDEDTKGVAVAVEREVVPKSAWETTRATAGARIEIVTAAAGG